MQEHEWAPTGEIVEAVVSFASGRHVIEADEHNVPSVLLTYNSRFNATS